MKGVRIIYVPAGPPTFVRNEELLPFMPEFTAYTIRCCRRQRKPYDLIPLYDVQRTQKMQMVIIHLLCELVEQQLFTQQRLASLNAEKMKRTARKAG